MNVLSSYKTPPQFWGGVMRYTVTLIRPPNPLFSGFRILGAEYMGPSSV